MIKDVRSIISHWPNRQAFAEAIGLPVERVHKWAQNNAIPAWHQSRVLQACHDVGLPVSGEQIIAMHSRDASGDAV